MSQSKTDLAIATFNISAAISCLAAALQLSRKLEKSKKHKHVKRLPPYRKSQFRKEIPVPRPECKVSPELESYRWLLGMDENCFQQLLSCLQNDIHRKDTIMKEAVPAAIKLATTLRYLATGENFPELSQIVNLSRSYCRAAAFEVCDVIYRNMKDEYLKFPSCNEEWLKIADEFASEWQFPHCLGALSIFPIRFAPVNRNTVLVVLVDAFARLRFIDLICREKTSNDEILKSSRLNPILIEGIKYFPEPSQVGDDRILPYAIVGDKTLPLMNNLLTPYPETTQNGARANFNSRLNMALQNAEKAVGVMSERFKIFLKPTTLREDKVRKIVMACCILHNFLTTNSESYRANTNYTPIKTASPTILARNTNTREPEVIRHSFAEFFSAEEPLI